MTIPDAHIELVAKQLGLHPDALAKHYAAEERAWEAERKARQQGRPRGDVNAVTMNGAQRLHAVCLMWGAQHLVPDFVADKTPLRHVIALLKDATGAAARIGPAGTERIRFSLSQSKGKA